MAINIFSPSAVRQPRRNNLVIFIREPDGSSIRPWRSNGTDWVPLDSIQLLASEVASYAAAGNPIALGITIIDPNTGAILGIVDGTGALGSVGAAAAAPITITGSNALTHATNFNRQNIIADSGATTQTLNNDATNGAVAGDWLEIDNKGSGTVTVAAGTGTLLVGTGFTAAIAPNTSGAFLYVGSNTWLSATPAGSGGGLTKRFVGFPAQQSGVYANTVFSVTIPANTLTGAGSSITFRAMVRRVSGAGGNIQVIPSIDIAGANINVTNGITVTSGLSYAELEVRATMNAAATILTPGAAAAALPKNTQGSAVEVTTAFDPTVSHTADFYFIVSNAADVGKLSYCEVVCENPG